MIPTFLKSLFNRLILHITRSTTLILLLSLPCQAMNELICDLSDQEWQFIDGAGEELSNPHQQTIVPTSQKTPPPITEVPALAPFAISAHSNGQLNRAIDTSSHENDLKQEHADAQTKEEVATRHIRSVEAIIDAITQEKSAAIKKHQETVKDIHRTWITLLMRRATDENSFVSDVRTTYARNLQGTGIDSDKVYEALNMTSDNGMQISHAIIKARIQEELLAQTTSSKRKRTLRQLQFFFDSPLTKEEYDAYLRDICITPRRRSWSHLKKLCLPKQEAEDIITLHKQNCAAQLALLDMQQNLEESLSRKSSSGTRNSLKNKHQKNMNLVEELQSSWRTFTTFVLPVGLKMTVPQHTALTQRTSEAQNLLLTHNPTQRPAPIRQL